MFIARSTALALLVLTLAAGPARAEPAQDAQANVLYSSSLWKKDKYEIEGTYRIESRPNGDAGPLLRLVLGSDFRTEEGPDLKLLLSPRRPGKVKAKNALEGALVLGVLEKNRGSSFFAIPEGVGLTQYHSVVIHCEAYTVLWGRAPLTVGEVVATGQQWTKKTNKVQGHWEIAKVGDGHVIRLGSDFKTKKAPDLKVVLSPHAVGDSKNGNALRGGVIVSLLDSNKGSQEFRVPAGTDPAAFRSMLIHCEQYTKLWGATPLR